MRRNITLFFTLILLMASVLMGQTFEGIIVQKSTTITTGGAGMPGMAKMLENLPPEQRKAAMDAMRNMQGNMAGGEGETQESIETLYVKNGKLKIELQQEDEPMAIIMDFKNRAIYTIYPNKKKYMVMTLDEIEKKAKQARDMMREMGLDMPKSTSEVKSKIKKTGKKKNINGFMCEQYIETKGNKTSEYWITRKISFKDVFGDYTDILKSLDAMGGEETDTSPELYNIDGFPILSITKSENQTEKEEVLKIEKKKLDDSLFTIPAGYTKITMQDMMQGEW